MKYFNTCCESPAAAKHEPIHTLFLWNEMDILFIDISGK